MLTIYRASAGAGKTHKLTGEYLTLLFSAAGAFRRILAVTFTNKATDEMKTRIVDELFILASGHTSDYLSALMAHYKLPETVVRHKARQILVEMLHDYSAFNISTIDRFFQQTMRAFTREIGLQGGYGIEMDQDMVLQQTIDDLLNELEKPEHKELLGWLIRFATDQIEQGGQWNLRREIMSLSREVFKESYKAFSNEVAGDIADKQSLEAYKETLYAIIRKVESEAKLLGEQTLNLLDRYQLKCEDFKGGNRSVMGYFKKLAAGSELKAPTKTFVTMVEEAAACYTKTTSPAIKAAIEAVYFDGLQDNIRQVINLFDNLTDYYTAKEVVRFYYTLGILTDISRQIAVYRSEKNVMLIADTTELLNKVINGSDAPFIYEKTGTHVDHYMIDEFQDTSKMQWDNFRPLIDESLAHDRTNLIVGDVKQSIYRFRNSDWELLDDQVQQDFPAEVLREETLKDNWRSCKAIVDFNNALFTTMPEVLQALYNEALQESVLSETEQEAFFTKIMSAYDKSYQHVPAKFQQQEGHVQLSFLESTEEQSWRDAALEKIPATIEELQRNGYALKDIAVLVRTNQEGAQVADQLLTYKADHPDSPYRYDIISDDALFIGSSVAIRFLIAMLRYLKQPENKTNALLCDYAYQVLMQSFGKSLTLFTDDRQEVLQALSRQSLYEVTEGLYRLFAAYFPKSEQVFIQAFLDMVTEYAQKETPDLDRFLTWWDEAGYRKTIATPDGQDAVRILTVHKSKGLGFKAVIIPFADWEIDHKPMKQIILWCHPKKSPFNRLHLIPVKYGKSLTRTIFAKDYFEERLHAFIDNLNTLYVAFTRSKEELIVFAPRPEKLDETTGQTQRIQSMGEALWAGLSYAQAETRQGDPLRELPSGFDTDAGLFEWGSWWKPVSKPALMDAACELSMDFLQSVSPDNRLQLKLYGRNFFFDDAGRKHGTLMHELLSRIHTAADIQPAVTAYLQSGIINEAEADQLLERLTTLLNQPEIAGWYDGSARIWNEVDILFGKGMTKRPDRVMLYPDQSVVVVDYKFGHKTSKQYPGQVRQYLHLIREMGFKDVKGYLWYVELDKTEPVE